MTAPAPVPPAGFEALTTAALLGTARANPDVPGLHTGALHPAGAGGAEDPARRLLAAAALESVFLAGATVPVPCTPGAAAPDDDRPVLPPAAAERLRGLLTVGSGLLDEWFRAARRFRAPHDLVVDLLDKALIVGEDHRSAMLHLAGPRGRWVAAQNPRWSALVVPDPSDDRIWRHGTAAPRRRWFANLRAADPAGATARLAASWPTEDAATRLALLEVLTAGLGPHDEVLLERALRDRSRKVRERAVRLLRRLPDSAFGRRMTERVRGWTQLTGPHLEITIPRTLDADAVRDGLDLPGPSRFTTVDQRRVWALAVSAPLAAWCPPGHGPDELLAAQPPQDLAAAVRQGWATAAAYHRDGAWAAAMLRRDGTVDELVAGSVPHDVLVAHLRSVSGPALLDAALLGALPPPWPLDVAERVLAALYSAAAPRTREFRSLTTLLAHRAPFELVELLTDAAGRTDDLERLGLFTAAADILTHRRTLHEELK